MYFRVIALVAVDITDVAPPANTVRVWVACRDVLSREELFLASMVRCRSYFIMTSNGNLHPPCCSSRDSKVLLGCEWDHQKRRQRLLQRQS